MPGGHSTLNTVVLGEAVSKSKYTPYFGHHSSWHRARRKSLYGVVLEYGGFSKNRLQLFTRTHPSWQMPVCCLLLRASPNLKICQLGDDGRFSKSTVFLSKIAVRGRKSQIFKIAVLWPIVWWIPGYFVFIITFQKKKVACTQKLAISSLEFSTFSTFSTQL